MEDALPRDISKRSTTDVARARPSASPDPLQRHSLLSFFELSRELDYSLNVYDFADRALFNFMGHLGTPRAALWLLPAAVERGGDGAGGVVLVRAHGIPEAAALRIGTWCARTLAGRLGRDRKLLLVSELETTFDSDTIDLLREREIDILAPLLAPDNVLGFVALGRRLGAPRDYERFELEVLQASIEFVSVALENSLFYQRIQESNRELRQAKENLEELDRAKTEFVSNMQHELRTPVTVIQMYLENVLEELAPESGHREHLDIVLKHAEKLKRMLEDLLDFSSLSNSGLAVEASVANVATVLGHYFAKRRNGVALQLRELHLVLTDPSLRARFDEKRLVQILDILLDNAVRFTPPGTHIVLRAHEQRDADHTLVRIDVEDDGPGIDAEQLPQLFVPFRQGDGSSTRETSGLGLGLALARRLVEAMGGQITASSLRGRGTTLTLLLPT